MHLFKIVSTRDEVVIGVPTEVADVSPLDALAAKLFAAGHLTALQYAAQRSADGVIRQAPLRRVVLSASGIVRIEPFVTDQEIVAPD